MLRTVGEAEARVDIGELCNTDGWGALTGGVGDSVGAKEKESEFKQVYPTKKGIKR